VTSHEDSPISQDEFTAWFGSEMRIEVIDLIWNAPDGTTVGEVRQQVRQLAKAYRAGLLLHEPEPYTGRSHT
jgi:hypothetical protein